MHARGAAAHGVFESYGTAASVTKAGFLGKKGTKTDVFVRFSTVLGSRGSADTVRDTRGFAVKFYTDEGTFDLVGNNMPVFFIQDGIKFPDIIHAAKPQPDREIPQAQSAHDTFWDFVSLHTEATHHVMWNMSDRGIPRSFRTMEGFGVHTFRLVNAAGETSLVKFHWKPVAGVHSLVWEEAQIAAGCDPDFHRRDMADGIEAGAFLEYELGIQVMPDDGTDSFEGIDLLDPTKLVPEELAPVQLVGKLTLNRNPTNYFAETEQVAFHTGNLVPGIEVTNDPLMQARLFSYLDTQLTRLGGPNFAQLPINRPHCPVNDMLRDGMHQTAIHTGVAPYRPNSIDGDEPQPADAKHGGYVQTPRRIEGTAVRAQPGLVRRPLLAGHHVLPQPEPASSRPTSSRRSPSSSARSTSRRSRNASCRCWPTSTPTCARRSPPVSACPRRRATRPRTSRSRRRCRRSLAEPGPDRRTQGRRHRRRRLRPRRHRQAGESDCGPWCHRAGHRTGRRRAEGGPPPGDRRPDAGHHPVHRVRRARRRRRAPRRPPTSSSSCCCRRRSGTARRSPPGATAPRSSRPRGSRPRGRASRWPATSTRTSPHGWRPRWVCTGHGTGRRRSWPRPYHPLRDHGPTERFHPARRTRCGGEIHCRHIESGNPDRSDRRRGSRQQ